MYGTHPWTEYKQRIQIERELLERGWLPQGPANAPQLRKIETDWQTWLTTCAPHTFTGSFASFHTDFWNWYWRVTEKRRAGLSLTDEEMAFLAIWMRGGGKSSNVEWAAIAEGALVGEGYVLYVSGTQALAEGHVSSIRDRLEGEQIGEYYPGLTNPQIGKHGNQKGWRQDFLITDNGWAIRPIGLDVGVRGGRVGDLRPTLIIFDDIDDHKDSPLVVQNKLETISRSIIPAGGPNTIFLGAQNLIHRNGVFNQIVTRRTGILSRRIVSGPFPAFQDLEIETRQTDQGPRNVIVKGSPTWADFDLAACQKFLDDAGEPAFRAEYQHDFSAIEEGRVIPEYDESVHVITWSQFAKVFKAPVIPKHWDREIGHDIGFTEGHQSAWTWIATSAANSRIPGKRFRYRGMMFTSVGVDEQAEAILRAMTSDGETIAMIRRWRMSHEKLGERNTYRVKFKFPFEACKSGKIDGIAQWRHYLRSDHSQAHPFHEDERLPDGKWRLGCPGWFDVVADDQLIAPVDDRGLVTHRRQTRDWRYAPDRLSVIGLSQTLPFKADEDSVDSTRMVTAEWGPQAVPLTQEEQIEAALPDGWKTHQIEQHDPELAQRMFDARNADLNDIKKSLINNRRPNVDYAHIADEGGGGDI